MEQWKKIEGYENYSVSNMGRVRNDGTGKVLKSEIDIDGYYRVTLYPGKKKFKIHRLVSIAFIPNPNELPYVNHKNEDKTDTRVENLEWCTPKYNVNYGSGIEKMLKSRNGTFKPKQCVVDGVIYISISEAARQLGMSIGSLNSAFWKGQSHCKGHSISYIT